LNRMVYVCVLMLFQCKIDLKMDHHAHGGCCSLMSVLRWSCQIDLASRSRWSRGIDHSVMGWRPWRRG
jgi:hypothetical protein